MIRNYDLVLIDFKLPKYSTKSTNCSSLIVVDKLGTYNEEFSSIF